MNTLCAELLEELSWIRSLIHKDDKGPGVVIRNADGMLILEWIDRVDAVIAKAESQA